MAGLKGTTYCAYIALVLLKSSVPASAICNQTFYDAGNITIPSNETSCTFILECSTNHTDPGMVLMFGTVPADITTLQIRDRRGHVLGDYKDNASLPIGVSTLDITDKPALRIDLTKSQKQSSNSPFASFTTKTLSEMEDLTAAEGSIFSPAWPANYPPNITVFYNIRTKYDNGKITVKFKTFNLSRGSIFLMGSSDQDSVSYSGGELTGSLPSDYHAKSNKVSVSFFSGNLTGQGFHLDYNEVCPYNNEEVSCEEAERRGYQEFSDPRHVMIN